MEEIVDDGMEEIDLNENSDFIHDGNPLGEYSNMEYELLNEVSASTDFSDYHSVVDEDLINFNDDVTLETQSMIAHGGSLPEIEETGDLSSDVDRLLSSIETTPRDDVVYIRGDIILGEDEIIIENGEIILNNTDELFEDVPEMLENANLLEDREHVFEYNISVANENTTNQNSYNFNAPQDNTLTNYNISRFLQRYGTTTPNTQHNISIHRDGHSLRSDTNIYDRINGPSIRENSLYPGSFEMAQYADRYQMGHTIAEGFLY